MNVLALDTETPKFDDKEPWKGNVYGDARSPVCWSYAQGSFAEATEWSENSVDFIQELIGQYDVVVGFNFKHDVAYLRRHGVDFSKSKVWDCQLGEFVLGRQLNKFPSLNDTLVKYGYPEKLDVVKTQFWEQGIDTDQVPWPILSEYAAKDAADTLLVYHKQQELLTPRQKVLVSLMSQDMLVLQEMERNGIKFNEELCADKAKELDNEILTVKASLQAVYSSVPINFGSPDQLSAFLYGGQVVEPIKVADGLFKTGKSKGLPKFKNGEISHALPRLFVPIKGSELKKEGLYATNEPTLRKLKALNKANQWVVETLLRLAKLETLNSKYYVGLPKLNLEMHWPKERLHGQIHQTLAGTGRLSSSKPNQQNFASELQDIFVSEYD